MSIQAPNAHWVVWMSLLVAGVLSILPLPAWLSVARPAWVPMVLMYWVLALPNRFGLFFAFFTGLLLDIFSGVAFGMNSVGLVLVASVMLSLHRRLRMFPWWQQTFIVFIIINCYQLVNLWIRSVVGLSTPSLWYLLPSISSAPLWPWLFSILRFLRRYFRVI
ncbi:rod shape-determining protein MreD [Candidatus Sororendozoicomonas aggregata]|uniref:rod shape-determining protein MreD n=1 Tax=Candidatus Sororendozoicomonas aggregata TaxID=3073239 RepID=UPI002ED0D32F